MTSENDRPSVGTRGAIGTWCAAGMVVLLTSSGCAPNDAPSATDLNLLVISIDTLRADHLSTYGYPLETSPNIDRLARQGHRFEQAFTSMPTTLPAHASLMTSLLPTELSVQRNGAILSPQAHTLAEILHEAGYVTGAFVSAGVLGSRYGIDQGFETYDEVPGMRPAELTLPPALKWLRTHRDDRFFLFLHLFDPHTPYLAPETFRDKFGAPPSLEPPASEFIDDPGVLDAETVRQSIAAYDAEIAYSDAATGRILDELDVLGLADDTLVVLLSDHGESLDELLERYGYAFDHGEFLYAHQLRIPLILRLPGEASKPRGSVHDLPVSIIDIVPTVLDLLGLPFETVSRGASLTALMDGRGAALRPVLSERRVFGRPPRDYLRGEAHSLVDGRWHLLASTKSGNELYDLSTDPAEADDLFDGHEQGRRLTEELEDQLDELGPRFGRARFDMDEEALERLRSLGYVE